MKKLVFVVIIDTDANEKEIAEDIKYVINKLGYDCEIKQEGDALSE